MRLATLTLGVIVLTVVVVVFVRLYPQKKKSVAVAVPKPRTLEEKLSVLEKCGLRLSAPFTTHDLLESWNREQYEKPGFDSVLVGLGMIYYDLRGQDCIIGCVTKVSLSV